MATSSRDYQLIIFGATGFTGTLTAEYLAEHPASEGLRWAVAGRNPEKLTALADSLEQHSPHGTRPGVVTADISEPASLTAMTKRADILITTVGPYVDYGIPVVEACVATGTHYLDITGEPEFWYQVIEEFDDAAKAKGVKLISCCGFDSIPADIGTYYTLSKLSDDRPAKVRSYFRAKGAASGGTWASLLEAFGRAREFAERRRREKKSRDKAPSGKSKANLLETLRDQFPLQHAEEVDGWVLPMPTIDPSIVKRSAAIDGSYGDDFQYDQYLQVGSAAQGAAILTGVAGLFAMAQFKPSREWLKSMRPSGEGPDDEERAENWFEVTYIGENADSSVRCVMKGGDPGYGETSKMLSECALCLALDTDSLPQRSGVLTTASAMGDCLVQRLQDAGIVFESDS
jgi:short subunit dehydrogenase-like uncharacterized protein